MKVHAICPQSHDSLHYGATPNVILREFGKSGGGRFKSGVVEVGANEPNICMVEINDESLHLYPIFQGSESDFINAVKECFERNLESGCIAEGVINLDFGLLDEEWGCPSDLKTGLEFYQYWFMALENSYVNGDSDPAYAIVDLATQKILVAGDMDLEFNYQV